MDNYNSSYNSIDEAIDGTLCKFASVTNITSNYFKLLANTLHEIHEIQDKKLEQKEDEKFEKEANKYFS